MVDTRTLDVLLDARLAARGLGIGTFVNRLSAGLAANRSIRVSPWRATAPWGPRARLATLTRSGLFDISPALDPRARGADVVHFACNLGAVRPGPNSVVTVHDLMHRRRIRRRDALLGSIFERSLRHAARVAAVSTQTASDVEHVLPELRSRLEVIPHGMRQLPRPTGERLHVLAFGGQGDPRKRVDLGVAGYEAYRSATSDPLPLVVLARAGLTVDQLVRLERLGARVVSTATDEEVDALMASAAALLFPTLEEGFGLPVVEAAEVGTPVVLDRGARITPEVLGPHCVRVEGPAPSAWGRGLSRAIEAGPVFGALSLPTWDDVADRYAAIYSEVAR